MGLPSFSIRRPVTTIMIFAGVVLFGVISLVKLPQELFPPITYPQLTVFTGYANAAPEEIETLLTRPIEEAVGTVSGLRRIRSVSREGVSLVMAEFDWDQNMDFASLRTREKIDLIKARLPRDSSEPLVVPYNPFELPVMTLSVTGSRSPVQLRRLADDLIKQELEKIDGVASASVEGGLEREIQIDVDQARLISEGVSIIEISDAITEANVNYPAGTIKESFYEYLIRTLGEFEHVSEIRDVVVQNRDFQDDRRVYEDQQHAFRRRQISYPGNVVKVKDVASVRDAFKERSSYSRYNLRENVSVSIQKQAQTNTMQVIDSIREEKSRIEGLLPEDVQLDVIYDQSVFIRDAINGVRNAAIQGGVLAFFVLLFFLKSIKPAFIVTLSIPISIMIVFTFMHFGNLSVNMMSLGGLALGVGMLVDNAVVVIENIFRHVQLGKSAEEAAVKGTDEVANAISASTLTTIAVFLPMVFVVGVAGQLFKQLAFTVTFSLVGSLWVALTLIPLLSSRLPSGKKEVTLKKQEKWDKVLFRYKGFLKKFLTHKRKGLLAVCLIFFLSLLLFGRLDKELMPRTDQGQFLIRMDLPVGTKLEVTNSKATFIENIIAREDPVESISSVVGATRGDTAQELVQRMGSHQAQFIVDLKQRRDISTTEFVRDLERRFSGEEKLNVANIDFAMQQGVLSGALGEEGKPITVEIKGDEMDVLEEISGKVYAGLEEIDGIFGVESDAPESSPEIKVNIDKNKAALFNISVVDLARTAQTVLRGYVPSRFKETGDEIDIRLRMRKEDRDEFEKLSRLRVNSPNAGLVSIGSMVDIVRGHGPSEIKRLAQERTITVDADIMDRRLAAVMADVQNFVNGLEVPSGYLVELTGETEEMQRSFHSLRFALILSLILVYMIMASQFESLSQPMIILFTVPLSIIGVLLALFVTGTSVNVVAFLGIIMLGGIVVNNGIVLIDYTNLLMRRGRSAYDAVVEASCARLRPIVMTALTTVLGLLPMALAVGRGSELRSPMAISVMGGLLVSTFLTLAVIPAVFLLERDIRVSLTAYVNKKLKK